MLNELLNVLMNELQNESMKILRYELLNDMAMSKTNHLPIHFLPLVEETLPISKRTRA